MLKKIICINLLFVILLKTSSQKIEKEVTRSSIMNKKIRKMLIIQLSILEVILFVLLIDVKQTSCIVETENDNLLVYNYANTLLAPRIVKEEVELITDDIDEDNKEDSEDENSETTEEEVEVSEEIIEEPEPVVEEVAPVPVPAPAPAPAPAVPVAIRDVNYSVAENLVSYAKQFVGYPYVYGGNSLTNGTDCSGFTKLIYAQYGIDLPRVAYDQSFVGYEVPISQIQIGDLVLSGYDGKTHHVAIYIGGGQIVHALNSNVGIVITDLYIMPITHVRRVL